MSNRTSESSKAIRSAWEREQKLVSEGKGTRDWTPKQQKEILEYGKAYDDEGKSFEGQHMKSAEKYPEYQGNPDNIQFLTREEHLAAHKGNWKNPTNGYYDSKTKTMNDFGNGPVVPCEAKELSEPVMKQGKGKEEAGEKEKGKGAMDQLFDSKKSQSTEAKNTKEKSAEHSQ